MALGVGKSSLMGEVMAALKEGRCGGGALLIETCGASSMIVLQNSFLRARAGVNLVAGNWMSAIVFADMVREW